MVVAEMPENLEELGQEPLEEAKIEPADLLQVLQGYFEEAETARKGGPNPRDDTWAANWDSYWSRYDMSKKAEWQSKQTIPKVAIFTERQVAVFQDALTSDGKWFTFTDVLEPGSKIEPMIERFVRALLGRCGTNPTGHKISFGSVFGDILKAGCNMMLACSVTWKDGRVAIDPVDAREIYLDNTGRRLYRIRRRDIDKHEVVALAKEVDSSGNPLYDADAIDRLQGDWDSELRIEKERSGGTPAETTSARKTCKLDEYLCDIVDKEGNLVARNQLVIVADEREIIRGPEPNPFWHGQDWIVATPMISVPFSPYGRSYVESFRQLADTYQETVNLLLDGVFTSMKAFEAWPELLADPTQLNDGISPNKIFLAAEDTEPGQHFIEPIDLGRLPTEAFSMLAAIKAEIHEDAGADELSLGNLAPKSDTTATEIVRASSGSDALKKPAAKIIEEQLLEPVLELVWMTALQHLDPEADPEIARELGPELTAMFIARRHEFRNRRFRLKADGISSHLKRQATLRGLLGFLNVVGSNPLLVAALQQEYSVAKLLGVIMRGFAVDEMELRKEPGEGPPAGMMPPPGAPGPGGGNLVDLNPGKTEGRQSSGQE